MSIYRVTYHVKYEALLSEYLYAVMYLRLFILFRNIVTGTIYTDATAKKLWYVYIFIYDYFIVY